MTLDSRLEGFGTRKGEPFKNALPWRESLKGALNPRFEG